MSTKQNISYIEAPITNKTPKATVSLETVATAIKTNEHYKRITEQYREIKASDSADEKETRKQKVESFDYVTMSGEFSYVSNKNLIRHSGYICIDIDKLESPKQVLKVKNTLVNDELLDTALIFVSPGGLGLKWVIPIDVQNEKDHEDFFYAIESYLWNEYHIEIDAACKDVARACFLSYDEHAMYNPSARATGRSFLEQWRSNLQSVDKEKSRINSSGDTPWDEYNSKGDLGELLVSHGYTFVRSDNMADKYLRPNPSGGSEYSIVVYRDTGVGFVHSSECAPLPTGSITPAKAFCLLEADGDWKKAAKLLKAEGYGNDNDQRTLNLNSSLQLPASVTPFWEISKSGKCTISINKFVEFLEQGLNLCVYSPKGTNTNYLVQNKKQVLIEIEKDQIGSMVREYLIEHVLPHNSEFYEVVTNAFLEFWITGQKYKLLDVLTKVEANMIKETHDTSYLYYKNGYVKVTPNSKEFLPYITLDDYIWERDILDRDFIDFVEFENSDFQDFCMKVSKDNPKRFDALKKAYGYMLHGFKDPSIVKAVIFIDEHLSEDLQVDAGGTGKSIAAEALSYMRPTREIPGKTFDPEATFAWASVEMGDKIVYIDDIHTQLDFRGLYNVLSNDFKIEKKFKNPKTISFDDSPKVIMTTNHALKGNSNSYHRRQLIVEFADHFGPKYTVRDKYGKLFYKDWDKSEWQAFDSFMIDCLQLYLKEGLSEELINYHKKQVLRAIGPELFDFLEENITKPGFYSSNELLNGRPPKDNIRGFRLEYPEYKLSAKELGPRMNTWCTYKNYSMSRGRDGNSRGFTIKMGA